MFSADPLILYPIIQLQDPTITCTSNKTHSIQIMLLKFDMPLVSMFVDSCPPKLDREPDQSASSCFIQSGICVWPPSHSEQFPAELGRANHNSLSHTGRV